MRELGCSKPPNRQGNAAQFIQRLPQVSPSFFGRHLRNRDPIKIVSALSCSAETILWGEEGFLLDDIMQCLALRVVGMAN